MLQQKFDELRLTGSLPSPSAIGLRVLELTQNEGFDQGELVQAIQSDPALSGRILKLANSVALGAAGPVSTIAQATMRIGVQEVRNVALGFTLVGDNRNGQAAGFDYDLYWARSLGTAVAASILAFELKLMSAPEAFTAGLLCGIGKLAFASVHPVKYSGVLRGHQHLEDETLVALEARAFGINHVEVSALMMEDWGLSPSIQHGVLRHMGIGAMGPNVGDEAIALGGLLNAAKAIADVLILDPGKHRDPLIRACFRLKDAIDQLEVPESRMLEICASIQPAWRTWGQLIGLNLEREFDFKWTFEELERTGTQRPLTPSIGPEPEEDESEELSSVIGQFEAPAGREAPLRILLIDDEEQMLRLISHYLEREGYDVVTATSSEEGLQKAVSHDPQLVISDWMLPGMSGIELCKTLRETEAGHKMYVLIVTAREDDEQVVEAFAKGVDDYIVKPFNPRILIARVQAGQRMVRMRERVEASDRAQKRQVADLGILTRKLRAAALTDPLTRLPNRRYAMKRLKQEWDVARRLGKPLSVAVGDIDFFKRVNDEYGHDAGDAVLRMVSAEMRRNCRSGDVLARVGGEEFLLIHTGGDSEAAHASAERLRAAVEGLTIEHEGRTLQVTLSVGVAERNGTMRGVDDLIKAGDTALYVAKEQGRNQVVRQDGGEPPPLAQAG